MCSLHGGMLNTSGVFSTLGGYHSTSGRYQEYIGGGGGGGYNEYIRGISLVHQGMFIGDMRMHVGYTMSTSGDIMSTSGVFSTSWGYTHVYTLMYS